MIGLAWLLLGCLIGVAAAQKRGFPVWQGVLGGALLGLFAPLMFLLSDPGARKCPHCLSVVPAAASVCAKCARELGT